MARVLADSANGYFSRLDIYTVKKEGEMEKEIRARCGYEDFRDK